MADAGNITMVLQAAAAGDASAAERLLPLVYDELRRLAAARLARTPPGNTLQPTALVHEAYLRVVGSKDPGWDGRGHFFGAAARAMRDILVDQARRKAAVKHGGGLHRRGVEDAEPVWLGHSSTDMLALEEALRKLEARDASKAELVMLRFFAGLTQSQIAELRGVSERTVEREWRYVKAWLRKEMGGDVGETADA